jgi:hypothetical protein
MTLFPNAKLGNIYRSDSVLSSTKTKSAVRGPMTGPFRFKMGLLCCCDEE